MCRALSRLASSMKGLFSASDKSFHSAPSRLLISELCIFGFSWAIFRRCPRDHTMNAFIGRLTRSGLFFWLFAAELELPVPPPEVCWGAGGFSSVSIMLYIQTTFAWNQPLAEKRGAAAAKSQAGLFFFFFLGRGRKGGRGTPQNHTWIKIRIFLFADGLIMPITAIITAGALILKNFFLLFPFSLSAARSLSLSLHLSLKEPANYFTPFCKHTHSLSLP